MESRVWHFDLLNHRYFCLHQPFFDKSNLILGDSKSKKAESEDHLKKIEETLSHIEEEIDGLIKKSENNAKLVGEKILGDAKILVEGMKDNSKKVVENKSALLKNDILRRASTASIDVARKHIIEELNNNNDLHQRLIDESIEAINGLEV